uniref:Polysacc_synt_4 domain-containing protein n=1 Tax=Echinostoma caproni TaxID=27848 RepID=A0A183ASV2_9TREM
LDKPLEDMDISFPSELSDWTGVESTAPNTREPVACKSGPLDLPTRPGDLTVEALSDSHSQATTQCPPEKDSPNAQQPQNGTSTPSSVVDRTKSILRFPVDLVRNLVNRFTLRPDHVTSSLDCNSAPIHPETLVVPQQPRKADNQSSIEIQWAIKSFEHANAHFRLLCSIDDPKSLRLTGVDNEIYEEFKTQFPDLQIDVISEDDLKSPESKAVSQKTDRHLTTFELLHNW